MLSSTIESVHLYRRGAIVERVANLETDGTAFAEEITLGDLPLSLHDQSVKVWCSAEGETNIPIAGACNISLQQVERVFGTEEEQQARERLEVIKGELKALRQQLQPVIDSIKKLDAIAMPSRPNIQDVEKYIVSPQQARMTLFSFIGIRREDLNRQYTQLADSVAELKTERDELKDTLESFERVHRDKILEHLCKKANIRLRNVDVPNTHVQVHISYYVDAAAWRPSYALHVHQGREAQLEMRALIVQHSGEDWDQCRLRLSTAHVQQWCTLPELRSLRIGRQVQQPSKPGYREPPADTKELFLDYDQFEKSTACEKSEAQVFGVAAERDEESCDDDWSEEAYDGAIPVGAGGGLAKQSWDDEAEMSVLADASESMMPPPAGAPAPEAPASEAPKSKKARRAMSKPSPSLGAMRSGGASFSEPSPPPDSEPSFNTIADDFLNFSNLEMPSLRDSARGALRPVPEHSGFILPEPVQAALDRAGQKSVPDFPASYVAVSQSDGFDYAFTCQNRVQVPADGKFHTIAVMEQTAPLHSFYVAVPREGQEVYRMVQLQNPFENPLLPGPLDLYKDDDFFITTQLELIAAGGHLDVGLGVEQAIKIARNTRYHEVSSGMLSGRLSLMHEIDIDVQNNLQQNIQIQIRERIPVINEHEEELTVKVSQVEPAWQPEHEDLKKARGRYFWNLQMQAHEKQTLQVQYQIDMSSKTEIVGGNRREA